MRNKGFTLIEMLIMAGILGVAGVILASSMTNIYRGQNKVAVITQVKQNGQVALDTIEKIVKESEKVICGADSAAYEDQVVVRKQGKLYRIKWVRPTSSKNGYLFYDQPDPLIDISPCSQTSIDPVIITNTDPQKGISIVNTKFNKSSRPGFKDVLNIEIKVEEGVGAKGSADVTLKDPVELKTSIELR